MMLDLFKWCNLVLPFPVWVLTLILIGLWWLIVWGLARLLIAQRVRPAAVIFSAQMVFFFVGAIFIFNVTMVPVVLIAFHGMAFHTLWLCAAAAILYVIKVTDKGGDVFQSSSSKPKNYGDDDWLHS